MYEYIIYTFEGDIWNPMAVAVAAADNGMFELRFRVWEKIGVLGESMCLSMR